MSHWSWQHFVTDGSYYRQNNSNKNAWCIKCLEYHCGLIQSEDIVSAALTGVDQGWTPDEINMQGIYSLTKLYKINLTPWLVQLNCPPMAGKLKQNMVPHLCKCSKVNPTTRAHILATKAEGTDDPRPA
jgi:hypothetical protein